MCDFNSSLVNIKTEPEDDDYCYQSYGSSSMPEAENTDFFTRIKVEKLDDDYPLFQPNPDDIKTESKPDEVEQDSVATFIKTEDTEGFPATPMVTIPFDIPRDSSKIEKSTLVCSYCSAQYTSVKAFMKHIKSHDSSELAEMSKDLLSKRVVKPKTKERKCRVCQMEFPTFNDLVTHFLTHYNLSLTSPHQQQPPKPKVKSPATPAKAVRRKSHVCTECGEEFLTLTPLVSHFLAHHKINTSKPKKPKLNYSCSLCTFKCSTISGLKSHSSTHDTTSLPVSCAICNKSFRTQKLLDQHITRQHVKIECKECGMVFAKRNEMVEHYLKHFDLSIKGKK